MVLIMATPVLAANGDIVGKIYSTDIKACINGVWVESHNIGGKTVVVAEDITTQIKYSDELRTLIIDDFNPDYLIGGENSGSKKPIKNVRDRLKKPVLFCCQFCLFAVRGRRQKEKIRCGATDFRLLSQKLVFDLKKTGFWRGVKCGVNPENRRKTK